MKFRVLRQLKEQPGDSLLEVATAIAILAVIMTGVLACFSSSPTSTGEGAVQSAAENIGRNQMEYVFEQPYIAPEAAYDTITPPECFSVTAEALEYMAGDPNLEIIRVSVYQQGKEILVIETLRSNY